MAKKTEVEEEVEPTESDALESPYPVNEFVVQDDEDDEVL